MAQELESGDAAKHSGWTVDKLGNLWCVLMHDAPNWPIHGHYTCGVCGRQHSVEWETQIRVQ